METIQPKSINCSSIRRLKLRPWLSVSINLLILPLKLPSTLFTHNFVVYTVHGKTVRSNLTTEDLCSTMISYALTLSIIFWSTHEWATSTNCSQNKILAKRSLRRQLQSRKPCRCCRAALRVSQSRACD